ncbi:MAG: hypothetical protein HQL20_07225 [Candidatus Omnitrophica bacterium]|nr:hypothetical protein [Candidatus Omnitrophota bacterium]
MANITMSIDDALLIKARKLALEKHTSVNAMVRDHLRADVNANSANGERAVEAFRAALRRTRIRVGKIAWKREALYDR